MLSEVAAELRRQKTLLGKFKRALLAADIAALGQACSAIDGECIWPEAVRRIKTIKQDLSPEVREWFRGLWFDSFNQYARDAFSLDALRIIMPPYTGGDMVLYRGESASNGDKHGVCWTAQEYVAYQHAEGNIGGHRYSEGVSRLLRAEVPAAAIITRIGGVEEEYLVDRRGLPANAVRNLKTFPQKPFPNAVR
jgi:hypothetical protein